VWLKRILSQQGTPAVDRHSAEYILNQMYVEATGNPLRYPNSYNIKDDKGNIPEWVDFGPQDRIAREVKEWCGLGYQDPKLPSYNSIGGIILSPAYQTLSGIQQLGVIDVTTEKRVGIGKVETKTMRRKVNLTELARLIEMDL
jgi:hypothetical protein